MIADALRLARPTMVPWLWGIVAVGFGWAHWTESRDLLRGLDFLGLLIAWVAVHAGTMWWNALLDQDEGEVLFGERAAVPPGLQRLAGGALGLGAGLGLLIDRGAGACLVGAAALAVLYSHPRAAAKGHPIGGPLVNLLGYGLLAPASGYLLIPQAWEARTGGMVALLALGMLGLYFLAQSFQREEDAARGYRTLVVTHGPAACVLAARACVLGAGLVYGLLALGGEVPTLTALPLLAVPLIAARMAPSARATRDTLFWMGACLGLTLVLASIDHLACLLRGLPGAGLCVRVRLPP